jgi:hypothetical protein
MLSEHLRRAERLMQVYTGYHALPDAVRGGETDTVLLKLLAGQSASE